MSGQAALEKVVLQEFIRPKGLSYIWWVGVTLVARALEPFAECSEAYLAVSEFVFDDSFGMQKIPRIK